ncbi:aminomethyl-transferring glycine dehydrogenase [Zooshikella ganghwensis]|uniref:Glycine dehydrogenase (decarboxylating) n=1 Tax=Zooshikella ganghwensis TaxID=202772 RepID=A0A4P9VMB7_9GAMM|nr:aminomethyl-transferring glycine dehydrogenase [Zooshikella ganghwensis]RDH43524.1 glycine dehydrogenase (aminomethyl-transferring) [Zooshikella ganghwensis]
MTTHMVTLSSLLPYEDFIQRHIGPSPEEVKAMLAELDISTTDELIKHTVPEAIRLSESLTLSEPVDESTVLAKLKQLAVQNKPYKSYIGMGYNDTVVPPVILRNVLENPGWYTAYTPYQPEISQGRLEGLLNFQQMVIDLTGMELANASLLDEATAAAEAMTMCKRVNKKRSDCLFVASDVHPQTIALIKTRAEYLGIQVVVGAAGDIENHDVFAGVIAYPSTLGEVTALQKIIDALHQQQALAIVTADLLSLVLLEPPGAFGADVVVGSAQRFGVPMGYGGPHAAFFATKDKFKRSAPGRIIGVSVDSRGRPALRMAMQTREQHIRREKATSNICTAQALLANMAGFYAVYHGPKGLKKIAQRVHRLTQILAAGLAQSGITPVFSHYFDTLLLTTGEQTTEVLARAEEAGINLRVVNKQQVAVSLDETTTPEALTILWRVLLGAKSDGLQVTQLDRALNNAPAIPDELQRKHELLTHPVFNRYHSETEMLRYLKRLENKDISLVHSMIPLGSCTMKLNATTEMIPVSWPEFSGIHPYAPTAQTQGYQQLLNSLCEQLAEITGYDAVSLQPNSGAQGEYAGLLAIRKYHESIGQQQRDVCLIPSSAHGTNPASASMAGMRVVIVDCDEQGNVDLSDLENKAKQYSDQLSCVMITYPSTHGVFEEGVKTLCEIIHAHGGQVYMDGANLNAQVGLTKPGLIGSDVSHLNLHKTFCIPHGGGGPGMGPIGVKSHLEPFLPGNPVSESDSERVGPVSAAPYGSASILPISWVYLQLMGGKGLTKATEIAILNANYIAKRLSDHYPVLYTGKAGYVAHECIIDLRPLKTATGVTEEDVAKRLMDFGFHAPTMSFPVPGTLMIEPTESESKAELDRFCEAMIYIRQEIEQVAQGVYAVDNSPLRHAPHTQADIFSDEWTRAYTRQVAAYPLAWVEENKVWPTVNRIDNVYGDRHLMCSCPPLSSYQE